MSWSQQVGEDADIYLRILADQGQLRYRDSHDAMNIGGVNDNYDGNKLL